MDPLKTKEHTRALLLGDSMSPNLRILSMDTDTIKTKRRPPSFRRNTTTNFPISVIKGVEMKKKLILKITGGFTGGFTEGFSNFEQNFDISYSTTSIFQVDE